MKSLHGSISERRKERAKAYMKQKGLGEDFKFVGWYPLGGGYLMAYRGFYDFDIISLFGKFSPGGKPKHLTLFCIEIISYPGPGDTEEYTYLYQHLTSSLFSPVYELRKLYHYIKERKYTTVLGGAVTEEQWEVIKAHYDYTCLRCGKQEPEIALTLDHVIPRSKGGTSILSNIQPLCKPCNSAKGRKTTDYRRNLPNVEAADEAWPE